MSAKGDTRKQRQAEHAARQAQGLTREQRQTAYAAQQHKPIRRRRTRAAGYLGTWEAMDAFESGRPMSDDDY